MLLLGLVISSITCKAQRDGGIPNTCARCRAWRRRRIQAARTRGRPALGRSSADRHRGDGGLLCSARMRGSLSSAAQHSSRGRARRRGQGHAGPGCGLAKGRGSPAPANQPDTALAQRGDLVRPREQGLHGLESGACSAGSSGQEPAQPCVPARHAATAQWRSQAWRRPDGQG